MRRTIAILCLAAAAAADSWEVERDVIARLRDRDAGEWARALEAQPMPRDGQGLLVRFQVLLRAGHLDRLPEVIDALAPLPDAADAIDALVGRGCLDLARRALERFTHVDRDTIEDYVRARGDGIDEEWLAARVAANDVFYEPWFSLHVRRGTAGPLLEKLAEGVRGQPTDMKTVTRYLQARRTAEAKDNPSWMAEVVRLKLASESAEIAGWFMPTYPEVTVFFLEHSLAQPFTEEDDRRLKLWLASCPIESMEPRFRDGTKADLARAYQRAGNITKAQTLVEELSARYPDGLPPGLSGLAGQVQHDSGARVIEGRIRAKEPERKDDAQYWLSRAHYFAGRNEDAETRAAFEKALALAPPSHEKGMILDAFARYLANTARGAEAETLLDRAFTEAEPGSDHAYSVLTRTLHHSDDRSAFPRPDDDRLWRHLAARAVWHDEGRLLERMARRTADRPALWRRAAALTKDADSSRAVMLAGAMIRHGDCRDAIPLLHGVLPLLKQPYPASEARSLLFDALVRERDWKAAEALATDHGHDLGRVAVAAAETGETREAMRIWARRTNLDRLSSDGVEAMVRAVGQAEVAASYAMIAMRDRRFRVPPSLGQLVTPAAGTPPRPGSGPRR